MPAAQAQATGWHANLNLRFARRRGHTALVERRHSGPLLVQSPFYPEGGVCHTYVLHPPGGVAGGDQLSIKTHVGDNSHALLTTPAAGKFYRCAQGVAAQSVELVVERGAALEWLPQENIFFAGTHASLTVKVALEADASFIGWDISCFGRPACEESFHSGSVCSDLHLNRAELPILMEQLNVVPGIRSIIGHHGSRRPHDAWNTSFCVYQPENGRRRRRSDRFPTHRGDAYVDRRIEQVGATSASRLPGLRIAAGTCNVPVGTRLLHALPLVHAVTSRPPA